VRTILELDPRVWRVLDVRDWHVAEAVECLLDVPGHGDIDCYIVVIPYQGDVAIKFRIPVYGDYVMCFQGLEKMFGIVGGGVFHCETGCVFSRRVS
jgi:hypothetical protein